MPSSPEKRRFSNPKAEEARLRALYRDYVIQGRVKLPLKALKGLTGPDCAFHLYRLRQKGKGEP